MMETGATIDLGPLLTNGFGDRYLYPVNRNAFDQLGAESLFQKSFGQALSQPDRLQIIVGTDSGNLLHWLIRRGRPEGSRFILVELPQVLHRLRAEGIIGSVPEWIAVVDSDGLAEQAQTFQLDSFIYQEAVAMRDSVGALDGHLGEYRELSLAAQSWLKREIFRVSNLLGSSAFIVRQLENLAEHVHPAILAKGLFAGKTAVVLGGGPSLDEILPWVKAHADQLVIIAVSRISRQLLKVGLQPHFIVSIDPQPISFNVSREMLQFHQHAILINAYHASPLVVAQWPGKSLYLGQLFPWQTGKTIANLPAPGPTVTNTALSVALAMGCAQVVLGGVDLCYSREGITHASGSNESEIGPILRLAEHRVETNGGWLAETNGGFRGALDVLALQAAEAAQQGCRIINPAAGAAKIPHVACVPLTEVLPTPLEGSPVDRVLALLPADELNARVRHYRLTLGELERARRAFTAIVGLAEEALDCNARLFGRKGNKPDFSYKQRMDRIEEQLGRDYSDFVPLVKQFGLRFFVRISRPDSTRKWTNAEIEAAGDTYYAAYRNSAQELGRLVSEALTRLTARTEEVAECPDVDRIVAQWRRDSQLGRGKVWQCLRQDLPPLGLPVQEVLGGLAVEFDRQEEERRVAQAKRVKTGHSLKQAREKAQALFRQGDQDGLQRLAEGLLCHPNQGGAQPLLTMVQGYLCELSENPEQALAHYQGLVGSDFSAATEEVLKRIAVVSLGSNNKDLARLALECLANGAVTYKPQYAALLAALGQYRDAADVYAEYLEVVPQDLATLIKLGQLYSTAGSEEAARQVFQMVLERDPQNAAAQTLLSET